MADSSKLEEPEQVKVEGQSSGEVNDLKEQKNIQNNEIVMKENVKKQATLLFLQGKRSVFIRDFQAAVAALSESCQLFSKIYSDQDDAMADPYFYYGKALLEVGRSESEVLGDQRQEEDDDEDDDNENDEEDGGEAEEQPDDKTNAEEKECVKNGHKANDEADGANEVAQVQNEGENEDINDLQLSWEYLELAKLIYLRKAQTCKETAIKLAETYLCLGENGLESENYSVAIEDIKQALEIQKKHLQEFDRRIAETYYQLGIAYSLSQNYDEAIANFKISIEQLNKKISSLEMRKKMGDRKTEDEEKDAFYTMDGEIKEIQGVIEAVEEKIKDMQECKNEVKTELLKQVMPERSQPGSLLTNNATTNASSSSSTTSSVPATDISHLIKKKRKNDEEEANSEKKTKPNE